jgi:5'(3')-deoxyribonucleotidase
MHKVSVFLDMDDVLVDLSCQIAEKTCVDLNEKKGVPFDFISIFNVDAIDFFESLNCQWWSDIPPTPWMNSVIDAALTLANGKWENIHVLTSLPYECNPNAMGACATGKMHWIKKFMPELSTKRIVFSYNKGLVQPLGNKFLFDDQDRNVNGFGSGGILIPSRWNSLQHEFYSFAADHKKWISSVVSKYDISSP